MNTASWSFIVFFKFHAVDSNTLTHNNITLLLC
uniref:Uncharacterized protein n=1 Tax=Anguilla anguilla TaxID=7936 RepID=A0A0E9P875_ANGAN